MSSGLPIRTPADQKKAREEYLTNLRLQIKLNEKNLQANKAYIRTGQISQIPDTRTLTERFSDLTRLRTEMRGKIAEFTDGVNATSIANQLTEDQLKFLASQFEPIKEAMRKRYAIGVPADIFLSYLQKYIDDFNINQGVTSGAPQQSSLQNMIIPSTVLIKDLVKTDTVQDVIDLANGFLSLAGLDPSLIPLLDNLVVNASMSLRVIARVYEGFDLIKKNQILNASNAGVILQYLNQLASTFPTDQEIKLTIEMARTAYRAGDLNEVDESLKKIDGLLTFGDLNDVKIQIDTLDQLLKLSSSKSTRIAPAITASAPPASTPPASTPPASASDPTFKIIEDIYDKERRQTTIKGYVGYAVVSTTFKSLFDISGGQPMADPSLTPLTDSQINDAIKIITKTYSFDDNVRFIKNFFPYVQEYFKGGLNSLYELMGGGRPVKLKTSGVPEFNSGTSRLGVLIIIELLKKKFGVSGAGLLRARRGGSVRVRSSQVLDTDVDYNKGIKEDTTKFLPIGRYLINKRQLAKNIVAIKRPAGSPIKDLPSTRVSDHFGTVMRHIVGGSVPTYNMLNKLTDEEKSYLNKIASLTRIDDKLDLPTPNKDAEDKLINEFQILQGQIIAGNDNPQVIKKFKGLLLQLSKSNALPASQVKEILTDLLALGH